MTPHVLIAACRNRGISLEVIGDRLRCRAPAGVLTSEFKLALAAQKAAILQILAADVSDAPPAVVVDDREVIAIKVWSDALNEAMWVVADALPRNEWPTEAPVCTHTEVKILKDVGLDTWAWVHATKQMFGAEVVSSGRQSALAQARRQDKESPYGESVKRYCHDEHSPNPQC
jgi:TubC N-terminal docking domain